MNLQVLFHTVKEFLKARWRPELSLLLGYSGGPDSKALLYLLLDCRRFLPFELHLAHVDHGWRQESAQEARQLQEEAERLGLPFHLKRLTQFQAGNLEEQGREMRLQFFSGLFQQYHYEALLLAHHADDQAEVVLKRIFEGAHLASMGGLALVSTVRSMQVWRPLLTVRKKQLQQWLTQHHLEAFNDPTNESSQFLRGRMRKGILPLLAQEFGKEITDNLCKIGEATRELKTYFLSKHRSLLEQVKEEGDDRYWNLREALPMDPFELNYLLKAWFVEEGWQLSYEMIQGVIKALLESVAEKRFPLKRGVLKVNQGQLFFNFNSN